MVFLGGAGGRKVNCVVRDTHAPPSNSDEEDSHDAPEWEGRDWDNYNYEPASTSARAAAVAGSDTMANLLSSLPAMCTEDIAALLEDLPMPAAGVVNGLTVEEAIQV